MTSTSFRYCGVCGEPMEPGASVCGNCGAPYEGTGPFATETADAGSTGSTEQPTDGLPVAAGAGGGDNGLPARGVGGRSPRKRWLVAAFVIVAVALLGVFLAPALSDNGGNTAVTTSTSSSTTTSTTPVTTTPAVASTTATEPSVTTTSAPTTTTTIVRTTTTPPATTTTTPSTTTTMPVTTTVPTTTRP